MTLVWRDTPQSLEVTIRVDAKLAAALDDSRNRKTVGRLVSRILHSPSGPIPLAQAIAETSAAARAAGLTDAEIEAELADVVPFEAAPVGSVSPIKALLHVPTK